MCTCYIRRLNDGGNKNVGYNRNGGKIVYLVCAVAGEVIFSVSLLFSISFCEKLDGEESIFKKP